MIVLNSFIHLFKTPGGHYFYDVNKNVILSLSEEQYKILEYYRKSDETDKCTSEFNAQAIESIKHLRDLGFLSEKRPKEMYHPLNDTILSHLNNKVSKITLQITKQCNLRCKYCIYSGDYENRVHSNEKMTLDTARKGIDFYIEHSKDNEKALLAFYGGEPLLEFEFIKNCVEYFEEKAEGKNIYFSLTTNATLLNEEIVEYFQKHSVHLLISLDGSSEIHNRNRVYRDDKGTFEKVLENLEMIKTKFPDFLSKNIAFNAVLDPQNEFSCVNNFFTDFELAKEASVMASQISNLYRKDTVKASKEYISEIEYEIFKIFLSELGYLDEKYTSKLLSKEYVERKVRYSRLQMRDELPDRIHHGGPCVAGVQRLFVDVDGNFYPCERVSESSPQMKIGNINDGFDVNKIKTLLNIGKLSENKCVDCWALMFCDLCAAAADDIDGLSTEKKVSKCSGVIDTADSMFKDICTLREFGAELGKEIYALDMIE
ncbi:Cys-rich peptide radical SAM maturase CcpM [Ruminiclostridium papyrosolvens DSM 2782]|uniref:Cys-rich peptide radical SAM maturase CcpM n=1 Tax=Ruminiclostridium papyrosolvens TaxID=29362 RepID=UPI000E3EB1AB|nr:Cys-rich peptide radical SAM maturase CcpM [Ruminiclostridium papyrosolvens]WES35068.1 Cys-rich peptide radical SAM maturase CcpM [Ruminiclostridium papyrosolvens DSM 2782]